MDEGVQTPKKKISIGLLIAISAVFLSTSALIVSIIQTSILREQQYASVWPHLNSMGIFDSGFYEFIIENKGVGPAIIKDLAYSYKGSEYESTREVFLALFGENIKGVGFTRFAKDYVFKSGEAISLLSISLPDSLIRGITYRWESDSVNLKITYSDVYGNCWKLDSHVTTRLSSCPD